MITQQNAYLMSAITNQNANNNNAKMVQGIITGMENFPIKKPKGQKRKGKILPVWDVEVPDMCGESAQHPVMVIISFQTSQ